MSYTFRVVNGVVYVYDAEGIEIANVSMNSIVVMDIDRYRNTDGSTNARILLPIQEAVVYETELIKLVPLHKYWNEFEKVELSKSRDYLILHTKVGF